MDTVIRVVRPDRQRLRAFTAVICVGSFAGLAAADPLTELEIDGGSSNNLLVTAQPVLAGRFTPNANPNVFGNIPTASITGRGGGSDIDFYSFQSPGGIAYFDVDGGGFDSYVALFSANGTLLADNDDSFPFDAGSSSGIDAFLGVVSLPGAGQYFVAVSAFGNAANATFTGTDFTELTRPDGVFGGYAFADATPGDSSFAASGPQVGSAYTLHISIPAPGTLVPAALLGAISARRRRRS